MSCGDRTLTAGWPTTTAPVPGDKACILDAFNSGAPAYYIERTAAPDDRHLRVTTYEVLGLRTARMTVDDTAAQPPGGTTTTTCTRLLASFGRLHCQTDEPSPADVRVRLEIQSQDDDVFPSATITNGGPGIAADIQIQLTASAAVEVPFAHDPTWDCTEQDSSGTAVCVQRGVASRCGSRRSVPHPGPSSTSPSRSPPAPPIPTRPTIE
jgi:hypothetical protein